MTHRAFGPLSLLRSERSMRGVEPQQCGPCRSARPGVAAMARAATWESCNSPSRKAAPSASSSGRLSIRPKKRAPYPKRLPSGRVVAVRGKLEPGITASPCFKDYIGVSGKAPPE